MDLHGNILKSTKTRVARMSQCRKWPHCQYSLNGPLGLHFFT